MTELLLHLLISAFAITLTASITPEPKWKMITSSTNGMDPNEASKANDPKNYTEPLVKPKILQIDPVQSTEAPAKNKRYYKLRRVKNVQRRFTISSIKDNTTPLIPVTFSETDNDEKYEGSGFGDDAILYLCKRSPGKKTSENRLCQINDRPKCRCILSECQYFKTFAKKRIFRCVES